MVVGYHHFRKPSHKTRQISGEPPSPSRQDQVQLPQELHHWLHWMDAVQRPWPRVPPKRSNQHPRWDPRGTWKLRVIIWHQPKECIIIKEKSRKLANISLIPLKMGKNWPLGNSDINQSVMKLMFCFHLSISIQLQLQCLPVKALQILLARKPARSCDLCGWWSSVKNLKMEYPQSTHPKDQKDGFFTAFKSIILISWLFSGHDTQPYFFRIFSPRRLWNALVPGKSNWQKVIVRKQAAKSRSNSDVLNELRLHWLIYALEFFFLARLIAGLLAIFHLWPFNLLSLFIKYILAGGADLILIFAMAFAFFCFGFTFLFALLRVLQPPKNHQHEKNCPDWERSGSFFAVLAFAFGLDRDLNFGEVGEPFQQICSPICSKLSARIIHVLQTMLMAFQSGILNDFIFEPYLYPFQCWVKWNVTSSSWRSTSSNKSVSTCRFQTSWPNSLSNMENLGHSNPYIDMMIWSNWNEQLKEAFVAFHYTGWVTRILIMAH